MQEVVRLKKYILPVLRLYNEDTSKAIDMIVEENKILKAKVEALRGIVR
jgi:hypothetical protein